jgi:hypothetical protein
LQQQQEADAGTPWGTGLRPPAVVMDDDDSQDDFSPPVQRNLQLVVMDDDDSQDDFSPPVQRNLQLVVMDDDDSQDDFSPPVQRNLQLGSVTLTPPRREEPAASRPFPGTAPSAEDEASGEAEETQLQAAAEPAADAACVTPAAGTLTAYGDEKVANRDIRVWHGATAKGP